MARYTRIAALAVLVALSGFVHASAAVASSVPSGARLEPARMFNPQAESLFAALNLPLRFMSPIAVGLFHVAAPVEVALRRDAPFFGAPGQGVASVKLSIPQLRTTYAPPSVGAPAPRLADARVELPQMPAQPSLEPLAVRTAPPALAAAPAPIVNFGTYTPYTPSLRGTSAAVSVPARVGRVHFETAFHAMQLCGTADEGAACTSTSDNQAQNFMAGTSFDVRTGNSALKVGLSSSIEHLSNTANTTTSGMFPYVPLDPDAQAGLQYFGLTDVLSQSVGAQVAVPVSQRLTIGLQYDRAHVQGDYGTALLPGLDARKDTYLGNLTYQLPNTSSAITLSARQLRYQDAFGPNFNLTQTRADLNFTVKF